MQPSADKNIDAVRKLLVSRKIHDAERFPIREEPLANPGKWLQGLCMYRVDVGAFSPKDPIPSPQYYFVNEKGAIVENFMKYFSGKKPADAADAVDLAITIVNLTHVAQGRVILGPQSLASGYPASTDALYSKTYVDDFAETVRSKIPAPQAASVADGFEVTLYVYETWWNTKGKRDGLGGGMKKYVFKFGKGTPSFPIEEMVKYWEWDKPKQDPK